MLLRHAWYGLNQAFRRRIAHLDLTPDQYTALRILAEREPHGITQAELTVLMASDPNTIASLALRMEKADLIRRLPHPEDRRARLIVLQPAGNERFRQARRAALRLQREILEAVKPNRRKSFLRELELISQACQKSLEFSDFSRNDPVCS